LTVFALTYAVGRQPVALVRLGHGPKSDKVVDILHESDGFVLNERSAEEAAKDLRDQWVCAVITIPEDFDEAIGKRNAHLEVAITTVDLAFSDDFRRSVSEAVVEVDAPELASLGEEPAASGEAEDEEDEAAEAAGEGQPSRTLVRHGNAWFEVPEDGGE